jgi:hypothetical protein
MSNKKMLVAIPIIVAGLYLVAQALVPDGARAGFFVVEIALVKLLATIGCFAAASRYRRGEYMGVAWMLIGANYALLFVKDLLFGRVVHLPGIDPDTAESVRVVFVVTANLAASIGSIMLARVWRVAGIALPGSRASQRAAGAVAILVAVGIVGWGLWKDLHSAAGGEKEAIIAVASNLGDVVSFSVIAPLLLTAIAMRGGALAWPWALVTASNVAWLFYDMFWSFELQLGLAQPTLRTIAELWRAVGCALALSAGLAQRWAIRSAVREAQRAHEGVA